MGGEVEGMGAEGDSKGGEAGRMGGIGDWDWEGEVLRSGARDAARVGGVDGEADKATAGT